MKPQAQALIDEAIRAFEADFGYILAIAESVAVPEVPQRRGRPRPVRPARPDHERRRLYTQTYDFPVSVRHVEPTAPPMVKPGDEEWRERKAAAAAARKKQREITDAELEVRRARDRARYWARREAQQAVSPPEPVKEPEPKPVVAAPPAPAAPVQSRPRGNPWSATIQFVSPPLECGRPWQGSVRFAQPPPAPISGPERIYPEDGPDRKERYRQRRREELNAKAREAYAKDPERHRALVLARTRAWRERQRQKAIDSERIQDS